MIRPYHFSHRCRVRVQTSHHAFTLIELLTVMAIILVLAGLILNIAGSANYNASKARAQAEVKQMETAMESYKADNGAYPRNGDTDTLNANGTTDTDPGATTNNYTKAGQYLFEQLSGLQPSGAASTKTYIAFKPSQLYLGGASAPAAGTSYIIDPFGFPYGYSTAYQKEQDRVNSTVPPGTVDATKGYNPTFDLWSTAGYATGGKGNPNGITSTTVNTLWVKNW